MSNNISVTLTATSLKLAKIFLPKVFDYLMTAAILKRHQKALPLPAVEE